MLVFKEKILIIAIIIIIIIIYNYGKISSRNEFIKQNIAGLWEGDPGFCEEAEIDKFLIYLDPELCRCWILICNKSDVLCNHITKFNLSTYYDFDKSEDQLYKKYYIEFSEIPDELKKAGVFSKTQILKIYPHNGKITLTSGNTIHFAGYKDALISDRVSLKSVE